MTVCPKCERPVFDSWFLFKSNIRTHEVCHNAKSKLCEKCEEPECACSGQVYPKKMKQCRSCSVVIANAEIWSHCPECGYPYNLPEKERPECWYEETKK